MATNVRIAAVLGLVGLAWAAGGADPVPKGKPGAPGDTELVERALAARKEYQQSLAALYEYYAKAGDRERAKWAQEELVSFHLSPKPSYRLDVQDVPPATLEAKTNVKEANDLFREAMAYKGKGFGTEYQLNQRRAEIRLQEVLTRYPTSDKIADVAYQLGDLYENRPFRQYDRAAAYFERSHQWKKGTQTDALLRAARLYDKSLNERGKAIDMFRDVVAHDTDPERLREAERRLAELTGGNR
ncbi:MAG: tetratricopeptide repeat protein [Fimbriiglobus sp.]